MRNSMADLSWSFGKFYEKFMKVNNQDQGKDTGNDESIQVEIDDAQKMVPPMIKLLVPKMVPKMVLAMDPKMVPDAVAAQTSSSKDLIDANIYTRKIFSFTHLFIYLKIFF